MRIFVAIFCAVVLQACATTNTPPVLDHPDYATFQCAPYHGPTFDTGDRFDTLQFMAIR